MVFFGEIIVAGSVHPVFEGQYETVGKLEVSMIVFIERFFLDCIAELVEPGLSFFTGNVKIWIQLEISSVTGIEIIPVVLRDCSPYKPERHTQTILPLKGLFKSKLCFEDHLVFLKGMISFKQLKFTIFW